MARGNLYGPYSRQTTRAGNAIQHYDPEIMLDLEISAPLGDGYTVAIGARNLFDNYPATNKIDDTNGRTRSEEHTSELQSLMRISYAVLCLKKKKYVKRTTIDRYK